MKNKLYETMLVIGLIILAMIPGFSSIKLNDNAIQKAKNTKDTKTS